MIWAYGKDGHGKDDKWILSHDYDKERKWEAESEEGGQSEIACG